jgi:transcriptional regulator with XRE-family HTH domain
MRYNASMESKLKALRESLGLSSTKLSYMLSVNQSTVLRYEKSETEKTISIASLEKYAEALGYNLEYKLVKKKGGEIRNGIPKKITRYSERSNSDLSVKMKKDELSSIRNLDPVSKLKRAYDLSMFVRKLQSC